MRNDKGFTLIELLAVIIILAIIALITTPIVLNVINQAREDAAEDSAWGAIEAVRMAYAQAQLNSAVPAKADVTFSSTGDATIGGEKVVVSGTKPTGGKITIDSDTGIITCTGLIIDNYKCNSDDGGNTMTCKVITTTD